MSMEAMEQILKDVMNFLSWYFGHVTSIALLVILFWILKKFTSERNPRLPPAPPGWPIIGHLHLMGKKPHHSLMDLSKKYGPVMTVRLGCVYSVIVSSSAMAKEVLRTQDHVFGSRCQETVLGLLFGYNNCDLVMGATGERWRFLRRICAQELFSPKRIEQFKETRKREVLSTLECLFQAGREGETTHVDSRLRELGFNIITQALFKRSFYNQKNMSPEATQEAEDFMQLNKEFMKLTGFVLGEYIPFLRRFDLDGTEAQMKNLFLRYDKFLNNLLEEHRKQVVISPASSAVDFVDALFALQTENGRLLTDETIKGLLMDLLISGTETSMSTVVWALTEVMRHPETCEKAQDELDLVVGRERLVHESDIVHLKYLQAFLKETYRLHPVVPLMIPHESSTSTKLGGYDIPERTRVTINVYALGRDPNVWENPLNFDPERFVHSPIDVKGQDFDLIPFGSGRRICAGMNLALVVVAMTTAQILHTCTLSLPEGMKPLDIDVEELFGESMPKLNPLKLHIRPRLPSHVYKEAGIAV